MALELTLVLLAKVAQWSSSSLVPFSVLNKCLNPFLKFLDSLQSRASILLVSIFASGSTILLNCWLKEATISPPQDSLSMFCGVTLNMLRTKNISSSIVAHSLNMRWIDSTLLSKKPRDDLWLLLIPMSATQLAMQFTRMDWLYKLTVDLRPM